MPGGISPFDLPEVFGAEIPLSGDEDCLWSPASSACSALVRSFGGLMKSGEEAGARLTIWFCAVAGVSVFGVLANGADRLISAPHTQQ